MIRKTSIIALLLGSFLMIGSVVPSMAAPKNCEHQVQQAEKHLRDQERKHGANSKQAREAREKLDRERAACRPNHDRHDHNHR